MFYYESMKRFLALFLETISLQTARGRLLFAGTAHLLLVIVPYHWLDNLSLYKHLGIHHSPSIGLTRAYWLILHSHLAESWQRNWMIFPVLAVGWSIVALDCYQLLRKLRRKRVK